MTPDRWGEIERLCDAALERKPEARGAFLDEACAGDADLRREVDSLLAQQSQAEAFLEVPPVDRADVRAAAARGGPPRRPLSHGTRLGPYEIDALIGRGGMGEVYRARDTRLDRMVAIKILPPELSADADSSIGSASPRATANDERLARFRREARAIAALDHPNIVSIHSIEEVNGVHVLTMELVQGETLDRLMARGPLALERILALAIPIADAVSAAHQRGIVHRDLKPANVMVGPDGRVKVLDFGLAKLKAAAPGETGLASLPTAQLTGEGCIVGTVSYMSPEQAEGKTVDHRTDIFSLGVLLYELATGERPFKGDTAMAVLSSIVKDTPAPVTDLNPAVPRAAAKIIRRCLVKDVEHRYQSAKDLRNDLEELKRDLDSGDLARAEAPRAETRAGGKRWLAVGATIVVVAAIASGYFVLRSWRTAPPSALTAPEANFERLTSQPGMEFFPSLSPDGTWVVYAAGDFGHPDIYLQSVGGDNLFNLTKDSPEADSSPVFSPDGERIAFRSEGQGGGIFLMGRTGESVRRLTDVGFNPTWSPDGRQLAFATESVMWNPNSRIGPSALWVVDVASGERRQVTQADAVQPAWSPHGHRIAYWDTFRGTNNTQRDIWTIAAKGGEPVRVTDDPAIDWNPVWAPDGRYLYFASDRGGTMNLWRVAIDEVSGKVLGQPQAVTTPSLYLAHFSFSADGRRMAFGSGGRLCKLERAQFDRVAGRVQGDPQPVASGSRSWGTLALSPDGASIAVGAWDNYGVEDLFVCKADGSGLRQVTDDPYKDRWPRWSPDGRQIAFYSNRSGYYEVWTIRPDGSGLRQLSDLRSSAIYPVWSSDGSRMAFYDSAAPRALIFDPRKAWNAQTPEVLPPVDAAGGAFRTEGSWSPDGRHIAGGEAAGRRPGVLVYRLDSRTYERLTDFGFEPRWLGDNRRLVFHSEDGKLFLVDSHTHGWHELLSVRGSALTHPEVSSDGRWLYFVSIKAESDLWLATFPQAQVSGDRR